MDPERARRMGTLARSSVLNDCAWPASYAQLDELLERDSVSPAATGRALTADTHPTLAAS